MPRVKLSNPELARLYQQEELSLTEIAKRFGVSRQAVHYRLRQAGVEMRPPGQPAAKITRQDLYRLYVEEKKPVYVIVKELRTHTVRVYELLDEFNIKRRTKRVRPVKYPQLRELKIGEYVDLPRPPGKQPHGSFYSMAEIAGIRVSCKAVDEATMRVTRVK